MTTNIVSPIRDTILSDERITEMLVAFDKTPEASELRIKYDKGVLDDAQYLQEIIAGAIALSRKN